MITGIILVVLALLVLLIATYTDFKTGEIPDWLSYGFMISALGIRLLHSVIFNDWVYMLYGIIGFAVMYCFSMVVYYARQWGGGDAKIAMGLGAAFATPVFAYESSVPYLLVLTANIFIAGGIYGMLWSAYVFARHFRKSIKAVKEVFVAKNALYIAFLALALGAITTSMALSGLTAILLFYSSLLMLAYFFLYIFIKASEKVGLYKKISVSRLTEGDWVAEDVKAKGRLICSKKSLGITIEQIRAIKKAGIKRVIVKRGIKFLIAILIGTAVTIAYGGVIIMAFL